MVMIERNRRPCCAEFPLRPLRSMAKYMIGCGAVCMSANLRSPPACIWWCCVAWELSTRGERGGYRTWDTCVVDWGLRIRNRDFS
jgi:hypothetical protein